MSKPLLRTNQLALISKGQDWDSITPPKPLHTKAGASNNYEAQWRSYINAARSIGWTPDDVAQHGTEALADELTSAGLRHWSPSTTTRYAKLARYAGVDSSKHPAPKTLPIGPVDQRRLWQTGMHPTSQRNAFAALITWFWPIDLPDLLNLTLDQIEPGQTTRVTIRSPEGPVVLPTGGEVAGLWLQTRQSWASRRWLFTTTHPSRTGQPPGTKLSIRGFQASFAHHTKQAGYPGLSWRRYRTQAIAAGNLSSVAGSTVNVSNHPKSA